MCLQPQFSLNGGGGGNNGNNWNAGGNLGVGVKVYESTNGRHSVGAGANVGQYFGRHQVSFQFFLDNFIHKN